MVLSIATAQAVIGHVATREFMGSDSRAGSTLYMAGHIGIDLGVHLNIDRTLTITPATLTPKMAFDQETLSRSSYIPSRRFTVADHL